VLFNVEFDPGTFVAMVERVVVRTAEKNKHMELQFELRSGQTQRIEFNKYSIERLIPAKLRLG